MKDVAASTDTRGITLQQVGVKDVHLPALVRRKEGGFDNVVATIDWGVELPHHFRGTHMSRFIDILFRWREKPIGSRDLREMLAEACQKLGAPRAQIHLAFKYFITKSAPVTHSQSAIDYDCHFVGELDCDHYTFTLGVEVPITCLCPCSKEISEYGAHNQRAMIKAWIQYLPDEIIWIEDLVEKLEGQGSAPIYPLLKREDEKFVTEQAYDNPKFVEDVLREVICLLRSDPRITWFQVEIESHESIHNHSVYASQEEVRGPSGFQSPDQK